MVEALVSYMLTQYLSPYFSNFSKENLKLNFLQGEVTLRQLFFNQKILDSFSLPLRLKFGNLEMLKVVIPSYMKFASSGLKIKIKNIFLCFEMLQVQKWSEANVVNSYQKAKKGRIKTYEQNVDLVYQDLQKQGSKGSNVDLLHQIMANISIEIENTYIRFEDTNLKFDIGILIPRIEVASMNKNWDLVQTVLDMAVLYKGLTIYNMDAYINYGDSFKPLAQMIDLESFQEFASLPRSQRETLEQDLRKFIKRTFEDSALRFSEIKKHVASLNKYIFRDQTFSIDTRLQYTLNKKQVLLDDPDSKEPDIKLDMIFGGIFKKLASSLQERDFFKRQSPQHPVPKQMDDSINSQLKSVNASIDLLESQRTVPDPMLSESLSIVIDEQQLKAALHFTTFMACYSDFCHGVLQSRFYSQDSLFMTPDMIDDYLRRYRLFRIARFSGDATAQQLQQELFDLYEKDLRTDVIIMLRDAETEKFFGEKHIQDEFKMLIESPRGGKQSQGFWTSTFQPVPTAKMSQVEIQNLKEQQKAKITALTEEFDKRMESARKVINRQFSLETGDRLEDLSQNENQKLGQTTCTQFIFRMPKLEIELFAMDQKHFQANSSQGDTDFSSDSKEAQSSIAYMALSGLQIDFSHQTFPVNHLLTIELKSLTLKDPQIVKEVKALNKKLPKDKLIIDSVIETRFKEENNDFDDSGDIQRHTERQTYFREEPDKLLSFRVVVKEDDSRSFQDQPRVSMNQVKRTKKDLKHKIDLTVLGKIVIYSNFAFVKRVMYLAGRVSSDIRQKRLFLIKSIDANKKEEAAEVNDAIKAKIREHIINGFAFMERLRDYASQRMSELKLQRMHLKDQASLLSLSIVACSPKFIIDDYLFGEPIYQKKRPVCFLLDMGKLKIQNTMCEQLVETMSGDVTRLQGFYESFDMQFMDLKITYSNTDVAALLDESRHEKETFEVFEKFDFGIQVQTLLGQNNLAKLPELIVNLKLKEVQLNFDRVILNQLFKVKSFYFEGSYNLAKAFMTQQRNRMDQEFDRLRKDIQYHRSQSEKLIVNKQRSQFSALLHSELKLPEDSSLLSDKKPLNMDQHSESDYTLRVNLLFSRMRLTKYRINWNIEEDRDSQHKLFVSQNHREIEKQKEIQLAAENFNIGVLCFEDGSMHVYVFLHKLTVTDLEHTNYDKKHLDLIKNSKAHERYHPTLNKKNLEAQKEQRVSFQPKQYDRTSPQLKEWEVSFLSQSQNSRQHISQKKAASFFMNEQLRSSNVLHMKSISFSDFEKFCPRAEYLGDNYQVAAKYTTMTTVKNAEQSSNESDDVKEDCRVEQSQTTVKIQKIKVVALLLVIQNIVQSYYNFINDYQLSDIRYKAHVEAHQKEKAQKDLVSAFIENRSQSSNQLDLQDLTPSESMSSNYSEVIRKLKPYRVEQTSDFTILMPEFQLSLPTNLLDQSCLSLKIDTGFTLERKSSSSKELTPLMGELGSVVKTEEIILSEKTNFDLKLRKLQMYLKYLADQSSKNDRKSETRNCEARTFKCNQTISRLMTIDPISARDKTIIRALTISHIIFPFDLDYQGRSEVFTKEYVIRDSGNLERQMLYMAPMKNQTNAKSMGDVRQSENDIKVLNEFKLQLSLVEVAKYQQLIQLALFYNQKIMGIKVQDYLPESLEKPQLPKPRLEPRKSMLVRTSSQGKILQEDLKRTQSMGRVQIDDMKRTQTQLLLGQAQRQIIEEEDLSNQISLSLLTKEADETETKDKVSIEDLIAQHTQAEELQLLMSRQLHLSEEQRSVVFTKMSFETNQKFQICLLDDLTQSYEESLLAFVTKSFKYEASSIVSDTTSEFKAENQFDENRNRLYRFFEIPLDTNHSSQFARLEFEASNFNHKSLDQEYLIEPYKLEYSSEQRRPQSLRENRLKSLDMFNVNVTYGCLLSLNKALTEIKEEIKLKHMGTHAENKSKPKLLRHRLDSINEEAEPSEDEQSNLLSEKSSNQPETALKLKHSPSPPKMYGNFLQKQTVWRERPNLQPLSNKRKRETVDIWSMQLNEYHRMSKLDIETREDLLFKQFKNTEEYKLVQDQKYQIDQEKRNKIIPKFSFLNDFGKDISFCISNEVNTSEQEEQKNWVLLQAGEFKEGKSANSLNQCIKQLLESFKTDELKRAQLFISVQVAGYNVLRDFPLFQMGLFTFKLQPKQEAGQLKIQSQFMVFQLVRNKRDMKLSFESNAIVYNNTNEKLCMVAFDTSLLQQSKKDLQRQFESMTADVYECEPRQVVCIPFSWFEKEYQVQVCFLPHTLDMKEGFGNQDRVLENFTVNRSQWMFQQSIRTVLDPRITDPYQSHAKSMLSEKGIWFGLEFALLDTRTSYGQFVLTFDYLCSFQNLLLTKLHIKPIAQPKQPVKISYKELVVSKLKLNLAQASVTEGTENAGQPAIELKEANSQTDFIVPKDEVSPENVYSFDPSQVLQIPELNLEAPQWDLEVIFEADDSRKYSTIVTQTNIRNLKSSKLLQFSQGTLIELKLQPPPQPSDSPLLPKNKVDQTTINIVLEKLQGQGCLQDTEYNNLSLRRKIYHHKICKVYQFFAPLIAVNLTKYCVKIVKDIEKPHITQTLAPYSNLYINLDLNSISKLSIQVEGYSLSDRFSLQAVQSFISMEKGIQQATDGSAQKLEKLEIACSVSNLDQPYLKTRVLRIVQRFVVLNKLTIPIVINQLGQSDEVCLRAFQTMDLNFSADNDKKLIRVRHESRHDVQSSDQDGGYIVNQRGIHSEDHWSYTFSTQDIDDFQIQLPKFEDCFEKKSSGKRAWSNQKDGLFVRVTITNDQTDQGKLLVIFSTPRSPDYLFINYLDFPLVFREREQRKRGFLQAQAQVVMDNNRTFEIKAANSHNLNSTVVPSANPFALNPRLHSDSSIFLEFSESDRTKQHLINLGCNAYNLTNPIEEKFVIKRLDSRQPVEVEMRLRESGNMRIVEIYPQTYKEKLKQDNQEQARLKQKEDLKRQIQKLALSKNESQDQLVQESAWIVKLQGIGFSVVDFEPKELCFVSFEGIVIDYEVCVYQKNAFKKTFFDFALSLRNFQVDATANQAYPVLIGPLDPFRNIERQFRKQMGANQQMRKKPFLQCELYYTQETDGEIKTKAIQEFIVELADTAVQVHLSFISQVQDMIFSFQALFLDLDIFWQSQIYKNFSIIQELLNGQCKEPESLFSQEKQPDEANIVSDTISIGSDSSSVLDLQSQAKARFRTKEFERQQLNSIPDDQRANTTLLSYQKIFVNTIHIHAIKIVMSLRLRGIEHQINQRGALGFLLNLSSNFADISDAEFNFDELTFDQVHQSQEALTQNLMSHYKDIAIQQFYQLFGSQDILGNPSSFVANLGRGAVELKNAPFEMLLEDDPTKAGLGVLKSVKGLLANTTLALSTSYSGISGSLYLGLRNMSGAGMTHENLDQPLSIQGGLKKGLFGFADEIVVGVTGPFVVPRDRIKRQGKGARQIAKGIGQGMLQLVTFPINSALRLTYDLSTGVKNQVLGKRNRGQRFRHPRHFDQNQRMVQYDPLYAFASTSLGIVSKGRYSKEVIHFALDYSKLEKNKFVEQVLIITDQSIMFIRELKSLQKRVLLRQVRGLMIYFYDKKQNSINLELDTGKIVKIQSNDPQKNFEFLQELKKNLKQLSKQETQKKKNQQPLTRQASLLPVQKLSGTKEEDFEPQLSFELWENNHLAPMDSADVFSGLEYRKEQPKLIQTQQVSQEEKEIKPQDGVPASLNSDEDFNDSDWTYEYY